MSAALETLPPDQRAVLQLILKQGRGYSELSGLLKIDEAAVRARAHAGLEALAPNGSGAALTADRRGQIADWLLGQQDAADRAATVQHLEDSRAARRWAGALRAQLAPVARDHELPDLPAGADGNGAAAPAADAESSAPGASAAPAAAPTPPAPRTPGPARQAKAAKPKRPKPTKPAKPKAPASTANAAESDRPTAREFDWERGRPERPSSKLGGALLLSGMGVLVVVIVVVAVLLINRAGDDEPSATPAAQTQTTPRRAANASADETPTVLQQVNLFPPGGRASGEGRGIAFIMLQGQRPVVAVQTSRVDPNGARDIYAAWLTNRTTGRAHFLGYVPNFVGRERRFTVTASLPRDTAGYDQVVVAREATGAETTPSRPSDVVLVGTLRVNRTG